MLRRLPHGRRVRGAREQGLQALHLPLRPAPPNRNLNRKWRRQNDSDLAALRETTKNGFSTTYQPPSHASYEEGFG